MSDPIVHIGCVANLYSRMMHFKQAGDMEMGHMHQFDHLTLLAKGKLKVTVDGIATEFTAPHMIYIRADKVHELVALTDETVAYCIHALRDGNGVDDIIDPSMIPAGVSALSMAKPLAITEPQ
jgi:quercetin dioxygenase-like cupin family protein